MDNLSINLANSLDSNGNRCAIKYKDKDLSYADLKKHIMLIHHEFISSALSSETKFVLCTLDPVHHSAGMLYATLTGIPYIPIEANAPVERIQAILSVIGKEYLVCCDRRTKNKFEAYPNRLVLIEDLDFSQPTNGQLSDIVPSYPPSPYHYILFTSGSTGTPKGAIVYRESFSNLTDWYASLLTPDERSSCLVVSSLSFDLTQKNLFVAFLKGSRLCFLDDLIFEPGLIAHIIQNENISWINCAPTAFYLIAEAARLGQLSSLDTVVLGGEPINTSKLLSVRKLGARCRFINSYGPTECTDVVLYHELSEADLTRSSIPLSKTLPHVDVYVEPAQEGQGELVLRGLCVGAGYIGQRELTLDKFYNDENGIPCYRTGDLFSTDTHGDYHFLSRKDDQIKLRGYRIELGEIEFTLNSHPDVSMSVAKLIDEEIIAFILLRDTLQPEVTPAANIKESIMRHLRTKLPEYFHPASLLFRETFPLNKNGKIDRQSPIFTKNLAASKDVTSYHGVSEAFFQSLLRIAGVEYPKNPSQISMNELGIDSIQKIKILSLLNFISEKQFTIKDVFGDKSIMDLCSLFNSASQAPYTIYCVK